MADTAAVDTTTTPVEETVVKPATEQEETMDTDSDSFHSLSNVDTPVEDDTTSSGAAAAVPPDMSKEEMLERAREHMKNDQVLAAARLMKHVGDVSSEEDMLFQEEVVHKAGLIQGVIDDLLANPEASTNGDDGVSSDEDKWIKMGESHDGKRDTVMYYKLTEDLQLKCRLETPIESSLLVPLLSVLNETDLFMTWMPSWNYPSVGLDAVNKLTQMGRTEQVIQFISRVPWPFPGRDVIVQTYACDDIDDLEGRTTGTIAVSLSSLEEGVIKKSTVAGEHYKDAEDLPVPPCPEGLKRAEFDGGLLIRQCPPDHASLQHSTIEYPPGEHLILVGFSMRIDGKISPMFPSWIINFVISSVITHMWSMFLRVAEEIRSGSRPEHAEAIARKRGEIYDWVDKRIEDMFAQLQQSQGEATKVAESDEEKKEDNIPSES
jgi:hypothetical protein